MITCRYVIMFIMSLHSCVSFMPLISKHDMLFKPKSLSISNILPSRSIHKLRSDKGSSLISLYMRPQNDNKNTTKPSKIFKMDFSEEDEIEELFKPRYAFGINEYQMILIKIYVYMVITIYCLTQIIFRH